MTKPLYEIAKEFIPGRRAPCMNAGHIRTIEGRYIQGGCIYGSDPNRDASPFVLYKPEWGMALMMPRRINAGLTQDNLNGD